jgi:actin-related protein 6
MFSIFLTSNILSFGSTIPNCIMKAKSEKRRPFIGNQINECRDISGIFYILSFTKGYATSWDTQKNVYDYIFTTEFNVNFNESKLIITEPLFNFPILQEAMVEIFFEEYDCCALAKTTAPDLCQYHFSNTQTKLDEPPLCCVVIDIGFSFTHIVPFVKGKKMLSSIRRIDVGGKLLTNHLKEIISYRYLNVMDESFVINQMKEDSCFVSQNFYADMNECKKKYPENKIVREYVLPDCSTIRRGYLQSVGASKNSDFQILRLNNERFAVPEILFHPSDVGINQMGIGEATIDAINACDEETRPHLFANIIIVGGSAKFPGLATRLQKEIRSMTPVLYAVNVQIAEDPTTYSWHGAKYIVEDSDFNKSFITRQDYEENGVRGVLNLD